MNMNVKAAVLSGVALKKNMKKCLECDSEDIYKVNTKKSKKQ